MEHPLIAVIAPLAEINPLKYALRSNYRATVRARLGHRAGRIFAYQVLMAILALSALLLAVVLFGGETTAFPPK